ncbi:MAG: YihY/virulence factor BrkB family protein [Bdellovibrionota bacterium]
MGTTFWHHTKNHEPRKEKSTAERGRNADRPSEIPATGWKDTLMRVKKEIGEDKVSMLAASMSYYALLACVPALTSLVLLYAWFSDPSEISRHLASISRFLPREAEEIIRNQLMALATKAPTTLGLSAIGTLLFSLWSASKGSTSVIEAMNIIYGEKECRGFVKRTLMALGMTLLGTVLSLVAIVVVVAMPAITGAFNFGPMFETLGSIAGWVVLLMIFSFYLSALYRFGPCRQKAKWQWVSRGSIIASVLWAATSLLFSWYASSFTDFNKTYGSLGAVVVLMTWFWITSYIILLGGEINSELERQTRKDTTTGSPKPLGARDAFAADTVGPTAREMKKA